MVTYAVLDVGGTSIKYGAVTFGSGSVDATVADGALATMATSRADVVLDRLALAVDRALETARAVDEHADVDGVAMAFPGPFDLEEATPRLRGLQKFDSIYGLDLRPEFGRRSTLGDVPIVFVRDSDAIGVGEAVFGAGRSARRVLTVALGTGCGTCLTYDGTVVGEVGGCTIELLHERSTPEGSVDDVLSARGLAQLLDIDPADIGRCLTSEPLDDRAVAAVDEFGRRLGCFLSEVHHIGFDLVVVAGGLARSFPAFAPSVGATAPSPCVAAEGGAAAALLGAVRLAFGGRAARDSV